MTASIPPMIHFIDMTLKQLELMHYIHQLPETPKTRAVYRRRDERNSWTLPNRTYCRVILYSKNGPLYRFLPQPPRKNFSEEDLTFPRRRVSLAFRMSIEGSGDESWLRSLLKLAHSYENSKTKGTCYFWGDHYIEIPLYGVLFQIKWRVNPHPYENIVGKIQATWREVKGGGSKMSGFSTVLQRKIVRDFSSASIVEPSEIFGSLPETPNTGQERLPNLNRRKNIPHSEDRLMHHCENKEQTSPSTPLSKIKRA